MPSSRRNSALLKDRRLEIDPLTIFDGFYLSSLQSRLVLDGQLSTTHREIFLARLQYSRSNVGHTVRLQMISLSLLQRVFEYKFEYHHRFPPPTPHFSQHCHFWP
jgi:hypothetical protein